MDIRAGCERLVCVGFERYVLAAAHTFIGGDQCLAIGIQYAVLERFGRESPEYDRVHRADAGARQHRVGRFRDHRHVDTHAITLAHTARFQGVGQTADLRFQFAIRDVLAIGGIIPFPDECGLLGAFWYVSVNAVVADVQFAAGKPLCMARQEIVLDDAVPALIPG